MSDPRPIPYPPETSAKGWRFELDYERIDQSDTWDLAAEIPMGQPALLMMWLIAWRQKPCGSFPDDEAVIRSKCRIPPSVWAKCREVCMRGWWRGDDGRLYHDTIVMRVLAMLDKRASDAKRAADKRERDADKRRTPSGVTGKSRVTPDELHSEFDTKHQAPTDSVPDGTDGADAPSSPDESAKPKADPEKQRLWREGKALLMADGLSKAAAGDFIGKLAKQYPDATHPGVVRDAIDSTLKATPPDPKAYLVATCQRLAGERNTVPSDAADKTRADLDAQAAHGSDLTAEQRAARIARARAAVASATRTTEQAPTGEEPHVDG